VGLVEIGLRLGGVGPAYDSDRMSQWQTTPDLVNRHMRGSREPHDFLLNTNADGLRTAASRGREEGVFRIVLMGDSNVFGWGIGDEQTLAARTQAELRTRNLGVEVINGGQPGYSTAQMSWLFNEVIRSYQPDLTILFLSMHDHNRVLVSDKESWRGARGPAAHLRVFLARRSRIYEVLRRRLYTGSHQTQVMPDDTAEGARVPRVSDEERGELLGEIRTQAQEWGGVISLGLMPDIADLRQGPGTHLATRMGQAWAERWSTQAGTRMFNIRACCPGGGESLVFPFDHGHMNAEGNAAAAVGLANAIEQALP
jgi:lysophospholipase L1-like esterase